MEKYFDDIVKNQATELYRDLLEEQCYDFNSVIALYGRETVRYALLQEGQEEKLLRLERILDINYTFQHTDDGKDVWVTFQKSNI